MAEDELNELYWAKPDEFTALRNKLSVAAKHRGHDAAAKRIIAARKPTTAAWVVNRLALRHKEVNQRLGDFGDRLRAAHAVLDGDRIRELSSQQRALVDELSRTALQAAGLKGPSAAVRDYVIGTLQAAIADPEVTAGLGRLSRAERWSGFGGFGEAASVVSAERGGGVAPAGATEARHGQADRERTRGRAAAARRVQSGVGRGQATQDAGR